jgi:hypothetical protein
MKQKGGRQALADLVQRRLHGGRRQKWRKIRESLAKLCKIFFENRYAADFASHWKPVFCHPERNEGSQLSETMRFFAALQDATPGALNSLQDVKITKKGAARKLANGGFIFPPSGRDKAI